MKLWLDDERQPPAGWLHTRNAYTAIGLLDTGVVHEISLDHDLGDEAIYGTGYDVLCWLEKRLAEDPDFPPPYIRIHTSNPSARRKMSLALVGLTRILESR